MYLLAFAQVAAVLLFEKLTPMPRVAPVIAQDTIFSVFDRNK
jgi:hypothetical protein